MRNVHVGNQRKSRLVSGLVGAGLTALGLSGSLALTGCDTGASSTPVAAAQSGAASHRQLAYFMLVDGRMGVADVLDGLKSVQTVKIGRGAPPKRESSPALPTGCSSPSSPGSPFDAIQGSLPADTVQFN